MNMLNKIRVIFKILLCISLIISFELVGNYLINLRPDMDGFSTSTLSAILLGDDGWTWNLLSNGAFGAAISSLILFIINSVLDIAAIIKKK